MVRLIVKKSLIFLVSSLLACAVISRLSDGGLIYAGFLAAFIGAAFLLGAWLSFMKARGGDIAAMFKRKPRQEVPYIHRRDKTRAPGVMKGKYKYLIDDDMEEDERQRRDEILPPDKYHMAVAASRMACGIVMLLVSIYIHPAI